MHMSSVARSEKANRCEKSSRDIPTKETKNHHREIEPWDFQVEKNCKSLAPTEEASFQL